MSKTAVRICYAVWDTCDDHSNESVRRLLLDMNFALDSIIAPVFDNDLTGMIAWAAKETDYTHLVIYNSGTVLTNMYAAQSNWFNFCQESWLAAGHIMHRDGDQYPWLHNQTLAINLKNWLECGEPHIGKQESGVVQLPSYQHSLDNVHDNYTPLWIKQGSGPEIITTDRKFGWRLISSAIKNGFTIHNIPFDIRKTKFYVYPYDNGDRLADRVSDIRLRRFNRTAEPLENPAQERLLESLRWMMASNNNSPTFIFNTSDNLIEQGLFPDLLPDAIWNTASGFKSFVEWYTRGASDNCQINTYDFNSVSLNIWQNIHKSWSGIDIYSFITKLYPGSELDECYCWGNILPNEEVKDGSIRQEQDLFRYFGSAAEMQAAWVRFQQLDHHYHLCNLVEDPLYIANAMQPGTVNFVWLNNIFYFRRNIMLYGMRKLRTSLAMLAKGIHNIAPNSVMHGQCAHFYFQDNPKTVIDRLSKRTLPQYQCDMHWSGQSYRKTYPGVR